MSARNRSSVHNKLPSVSRFTSTFMERKATVMFNLNENLSSDEERKESTIKRNPLTIDVNDNEANSLLSTQSKKDMMQTLQDKLNSIPYSKAIEGLANI